MPNVVAILTSIITLQCSDLKKSFKACHHADMTQHDDLLIVSHSQLTQGCQVYVTEDHLRHLQHSALQKRRQKGGEKQTGVCEVTWPVRLLDPLAVTCTR